MFCQSFSPDAIDGAWLTAKKDAHATITRVGNYNYGRIVWLKDAKEKDGLQKLT